MSDSKIVVKNASWIIAAKLVRALFAFIISFLSARYLGPSNFGLINYAASIVGFAESILSLGLTNIIVQEFVQRPEQEGEILGTSITLNFFSAIACIAGIAVFTVSMNVGQNLTILVCMLYSISLFFEVLDLLNYWFQAKLLSKYTSVVALISYLVVSAYKFFLLATGKSVVWFAVSYAMDFAIIGISLLIIYKHLGGQKLTYSGKTAKRMLSVSKYYIISNIMVSVFMQTDKIMLKHLISVEETGFYSVAMALAGAAGFIYNAIIDSARPVIFEAEKESKESFNEKMTNLYSIVIYTAILEGLFFLLISDFAIPLIYGSEYTYSATIIKVLIWHLPFAYIGIVRNIWLLSEKQYKYQWVINLSGAIANVILNYFLISLYGAVGAAIATDISAIITNVIVGLIIKPIRPNYKLVIKSLNPKRMIEMCGILIKTFKGKGTV